MMRSQWSATEMKNTNRDGHFQMFLLEKSRPIWRFDSLGLFLTMPFCVPGRAALTRARRSISGALLLGLTLAGLTFPVLAQVQTPAADLPSPALAQRLKKLESELRCLVCQNQTLAESPAGLAGDLRREVRTLIEQGKSDDEIKTYLQARYGDFVLYRPPVDRKTYLLWFGPFVLLVGGAMLLWWMARRRRQAIGLPDTRDANATAQARNLLNDE